MIIILLVISHILNITPKALKLKTPKKVIKPIKAWDHWLNTILLVARHDWKPIQGNLWMESTLLAIDSIAPNSHRRSL